MSEEYEKRKAKGYYKRNNTRAKERAAEKAAEYQEAARKEAERQRQEQERKRKEAEEHARNVDRGKYGNEVKHTIVEVRKRYIKQGEYHEPQTGS